jgi:hypothetical protein
MYYSHTPIYFIKSVNCNLGKYQNFFKLHKIVTHTGQRIHPAPQFSTERCSFAHLYTPNDGRSRATCSLTAI